MRVTSLVKPIPLSKVGQVRVAVCGWKARALPATRAWPGPMPAMPEAAGGAEGRNESRSNPNITVAVRVRPLAPKEKLRQSWCTVEVVDDTHVLVSKRRGLEWAPMGLVLSF